MLRRLIRRAVGFGEQIGINTNFLAHLLPAVVASHGEAYPELKEREAMIRSFLDLEEDAFRERMLHGLQILDKVYIPSDSCTEFLCSTLERV